MELESAQADHAIPRGEVDHFCSLLVDGLQVRLDHNPIRGLSVESPSSPACLLLGPSTNPSAELAACEVGWVKSCRHILLREASQASWTRLGCLQVKRRLLQGLHLQAQRQTGLTHSLGIFLSFLPCRSLTISGNSLCQGLLLIPWMFLQAGVAFILSAPEGSGAAAASVRSEGPEFTAAVAKIGFAVQFLRNGLGNWQGKVLMPIFVGMLPHLLQAQVSLCLSLAHCLQALLDQQFWDSGGSLGRP